MRNSKLVKLSKEQLLKLRGGTIQQQQASDFQQAQTIQTQMQAEA